MTTPPSQSFDEDPVTSPSAAETIPSVGPTPRFEPSWWHHGVPQISVERCIRRRPSVKLRLSESEWLHKQLIALGHAANRRSQYLMAHAWFECAHCTSGSVSDALSSTNMRLRLGQCSLAKAIYEQLLQMSLTTAQRQVAERKLQEADEAITQRAADFNQTYIEDEVMQLVSEQPLAAQPVPEPEMPMLIRRLREQGHYAHERSDFEAAHLWFDCAWTQSRQVSDLLSAANMRFKLDPASPAAETLYLYVLTMPGLTAKEQRMAEMKLGSMRGCGEPQELQGGLPSDARIGGLNLVMSWSE